MPPKFFGRDVYSDTMTGCVPVNMFAPSLYGLGQTLGYGDFATQAERDYLFDTRDFTTDYTQTLFTAYANGFLFDMPGGTAMGGIGVEWREDDIESIPDDVAREGQLWGFFADARLNPHASLITGVVCGVRVEHVDDPLMQKIRYLDKLVDELAKGKSMDRILRA